MVVHPSLPVKSVKELIALATAQPGQILYASIGNGMPSHLSAEMLNSMAGVTLTHIAYKGGAPDELDKLVRDDIAKWGAVVRKLGLTAD